MKRLYLIGLFSAIFMLMQCIERHHLHVWFLNLVLRMFCQEFLSRSSTPNSGWIHTDISTEKSFNDEHTVKSRGWLNWLSRGMLGAGGTDDSSQFSGVVSYDVKVPVLNYLLKV